MDGQNDQNNRQEDQNRSQNNNNNNNSQEDQNSIQSQRGYGSLSHLRVPRNLPPGYRFCPTDEELATSYLLPMIEANEIVPIMQRVELYKKHPQKLSEQNPMAAVDGKNWYFITSRERKYPNGARPDRYAIGGYWKASNKCESFHTVGNYRVAKRNLAFHEKEKSTKGEGIKNGWLMNEFIVTCRDETTGSFENGIELNDWVLCKMYKKPKRSRDEYHEEPETPRVLERSRPNNLSSEEVEIAQTHEQGQSNDQPLRQRLRPNDRNNYHQLFHGPMPSRQPVFYPNSGPRLTGATWSTQPSAPYSNRQAVNNGSVWGSQFNPPETALTSSTRLQNINRQNFSGACDGEAGTSSSFNPSERSRGACAMNTGYYLPFTPSVVPHAPISRTEVVRRCVIPDGQNQLFGVPPVNNPPTNHGVSSSYQMKPEHGPSFLPVDSKFDYMGLESYTISREVFQENPFTYQDLPTHGLRFSYGGSSSGDTYIGVTHDPTTLPQPEDPSATSAQVPSRNSDQMQHLRSHLEEPPMANDVQNVPPLLSPLPSPK